MDPKTLLKVLKVAVREVIKEELTDILREGLQSTVTEMKQPARTVAPAPRVMMEGGLPPTPTMKSAPKFNDSRYAKILNETDPLEEHRPLAMNSFSDLVNEGMDEIRMTSRDAQGFGHMRNNMQSAMQGRPAAPQVMQDPETGKVMQVPTDVAQAMTRDYSALMKAMNNKKGG